MEWFYQKVYQMHILVMYRRQFYLMSRFLLFQFIISLLLLIPGRDRSFWSEQLWEPISTEDLQHTTLTNDCSIVYWFDILVRNDLFLVGSQLLLRILKCIFVFLLFLVFWYIPWCSLDVPWYNILFYIYISLQLIFFCNLFFYMRSYTRCILLKGFLASRLGTNVLGLIKIFPGHLVSFHSSGGWLECLDLDWIAVRTSRWNNA